MGVGHRSTTQFFFLTARRLLLRRDSPSTRRKNNNAQSYLPVTEALPLAAKSMINAGTSKYQHVLFPGQLHKRGFCKDHQQGGCLTFLRKNLLMFSKLIFFHWQKNTHYICTPFSNLWMFLLFVDRVFTGCLSEMREWGTWRLANPVDAIKCSLSSSIMVYLTCCICCRCPSYSPGWLCQPEPRPSARLPE